jgi:hypothetical protein
MSIISILAVVFALTATILAFIFIVPEKKRAQLGGFGKFIHDTLNFKYLIVEKILQAIYIFSTAFIILLGFFMLFYVQPGYSGYRYSTPSVWYGGRGLLLMILGPIVIRLVYEGLMMAILLVKNVIQINNKLKGEENGNTANAFGGPAIEKPAARLCPNCGTHVKSGNFCPKCGTQIPQ